MEHSSDSTPTSFRERRRTIFESTVERYAARGVVLGDPDYLALIDAWIAGTVTMREAIDRWHACLAARRPSPAPAVFSCQMSHYADMTTEELLTEIETVAGLWPAPGPDGSA